VPEVDDGIDPDLREPHIAPDLEEAIQQTIANWEANNAVDTANFVFDIEDTRKKYADACNELLTHLPPELVIQIAKHLDTKKSDFYYDIEYSEKDFPVVFKPKYKLQSIPEKLTKTFII
jgi:hypothetical protein